MRHKNTLLVTFALMALLGGCGDDKEPSQNPPIADTGTMDAGMNSGAEDDGCFG